MISIQKQSGPARRRAGMLLGLVLMAAVPVFAQNAPNTPADPTAAAAPAAGNGGLIPFAELKIPSADTLMTGEPLDWIVLNPKEDVLVAQPVYPRPDTLTKMAQQREILSSRATRPKQEPGEGQNEYDTRMKRLDEAAANLTIVLPEGTQVEGSDQAAEYKLPYREVKRIVYHEDLMVRRTNMLIDEGQLETAFEMLLALQRRDGAWPGYAEARNRLIFEEANLRLKSNDLEAALAFFEELYGLAAGYRGLNEGIGGTIDKLVDESIQQNDLRRARYYIARLKESDEQHPTAVKWVADFSNRTSKLLSDAKAAGSRGEYDQAMTLAKEATRIWPAYQDLRNEYRPIANRYQVLDAGVTRFPGEKSVFFLPTRADRRRHSLVATDLFEIRRFERAAFYESRHFEEWTPTDLGRRIIFTLRSRRQNWEASPLLTAPDVVRSLGDRIRPESRWYDERLAAFIRSLEVNSPYEFVVNFSSVPSRPQSLFQFAVREPSSSGIEAPPVAGAEATSEPAGEDSLHGLLSTRFQMHASDENSATFRRTIPQPDRLPRYLLSEVVERRYGNDEKTIGALLQGDVSMLPHLPIWLADRFEADARYKLVPYGIPTTHVLQFNPQSKPLQNAEFRRALAFVLDRERILKENILQVTAEDAKLRGRLVSGPFPSSSYANRVQVKPRERDLPLAFSLMAVSKKRLGGTIPPLKMICEPDETIRAAAAQIVAQWDRMGVKVTLLPDDVETPDDWDIVYRTVSMAEPVSELWPFLTLKTEARVEDLQHLPDWLRQLLIELEQAVDFGNAVDVLQRLHFRLHELVHIIPLWEIDDVMVVRENISGYPTGLMHPYQGIERWTVAPWYATDGDTF